MQYLLYCVICFKVWSTTKEVFMVNVVDVAMIGQLQGLGYIYKGAFCEF